MNWKWLFGSTIHLNLQTIIDDHCFKTDNSSNVWWIDRLLIPDWIRFSPREGS